LPQRRRRGRSTGIVGDEQPAWAHARCCHVEDAGVVVLIHVAEEDVELLFALGQQLQRISGVNLDAIGNAGLSEVAPGFVSVLSGCRRCSGPCRLRLPLLPTI